MPSPVAGISVSSQLGTGPCGAGTRDSELGLGSFLSRGARPALSALCSPCQRQRTLVVAVVVSLIAIFLVPGFAS